MAVPHTIGLGFPGFAFLLLHPSTISTSNMSRQFNCKPGVYAKGGFSGCSAVLSGVTSSKLGSSSSYQARSKGLGGNFGSRSLYSLRGTRNISFSVAGGNGLNGSYEETVPQMLSDLPKLRKEQNQNLN